MVSSRRRITNSYNVKLCVCSLLQCIHFMPLIQFATTAFCHFINTVGRGLNVSFSTAIFPFPSAIQDCLALLREH